MNRSGFLGILTAAGTSALATGKALEATGTHRTTETAITLETPTGSIYGTLTSTLTSGQVPVALIIPGSGPVDRNGNSGSEQPNTYKLLAIALATKRIACVRYDKRGVAASAGALTSEFALRFETYIDDAAAWLRKLYSDSRFSRSIVAGHSEGSLVGIVALEHAPADTFVSLEGAGRSSADVLRQQLKVRLTPALYAEANSIITKLQKGETTSDVPAALLRLFRPSVQPYQISKFKYDPAIEIAKLRIRATIVHGTADVQVTMTDAEALHRADPRARFDIITGMNHELKYAPDISSRAAILEGYTNPTLPVDPTVVNAIASA